MDDYVRPEQLSFTPTTRQAVREAPRTHGRVTRQNKPGFLPHSEAPRIADAETHPNLRAAQKRAMEAPPTPEGGRAPAAAPSEGAQAGTNKGGPDEGRQTRVGAKRQRRAHGITIGSKRNSARHIKLKRLYALVDEKLAKEKEEATREPRRTKTLTLFGQHGRVVQAGAQPPPQLPPGAQPWCPPD